MVLDYRDNLELKVLNYAADKGSAPQRLYIGVTNS
jgi:hypothetical protein